MQRYRTQKWPTNKCTVINKSWKPVCIYASCHKLSPTRTTNC